MTSRGEKTVAPVRRQYLQIKSRFPDTILFFRLGDFYETFEHDAKIASQVLNITLTSRDMGKGMRVALAGIPHHAAEGYIARLVQAGHKVAICEQIGAAEKGRSLIERDVTRVVTPGTVTEPSMLDAQRNTYIAGCGARRSPGGHCLRRSFHWRIRRHADGRRVRCRSDGLGQSARSCASARWKRSFLVAAAADWRCARLLAASTRPPSAHTDAGNGSLDHAAELLLQHFAVETLDGFGARPAGSGGARRWRPPRLPAGDATLRLAQLSELHTFSTEGYMVLDAQARRNLELLETPAATNATA